MDLETVVTQNVNDIKTLTNQVTRLATIFEQTEKQRAGDNDSLHEMARNMQSLNDKIGQALSLSKDISALRDTISERAEDIGALRHDVKNLQQGAQAISIIREKYNEMDKLLTKTVTIVDGQQTLINKVTGGASAIEKSAVVLWAVFGGAISVLVIFVIKQYLASKGAPISGE